MMELEQIGRGDPDAVIARLDASAPRRAVGTAVLAILGASFVFIALWQPPSGLLWRAILLGLGTGGLALAHRLWGATAVALELTGRELREAGGRRLAEVSEMSSVNRGTFAFKPSNGFVIVLRRPESRVWAPGLWWRIGRRVGVGGVTSGHAARHMAEMLVLLLDRRG